MFPSATNFQFSKLEPKSLAKFSQPDTSPSFYLLCHRSRSLATIYPLSLLSMMIRQSDETRSKFDNEKANVVKWSTIGVHRHTKLHCICHLVVAQLEGKNRYLPSGLSLYQACTGDRSRSFSGSLCMEPICNCNTLRGARYLATRTRRQRFCENAESDLLILSIYLKDCILPMHTASTALVATKKWIKTC